jgi:hypothetical protein
LQQCPDFTTGHTPPQPLAVDSVVRFLYQWTGPGPTGGTIKILFFSVPTVISKQSMAPRRRANCKSRSNRAYWAYLDVLQMARPRHGGGPTSPWAVHCYDSNPTSKPILVGGGPLLICRAGEVGPPISLPPTPENRFCWASRAESFPRLLLWASHNKPR